ncbi:MAG: hypothetical protein NTW86_28930, partial [Candidatus Sumerlaeota bacterium]|nr:hypothetical protein [Candidatus Sumerlaeota bacterium]
MAPTSDRQFFEMRLPKGAQIWSMLVNGEGVKPARNDAPDSSTVLLAPLPAASAGGAADYTVAALYREQGPPLVSDRRLGLVGPSLSVPVNRTRWSLNLPPEFEYLEYGGSMLNTTTVREPLATFLRTAYYPVTVLFSEGDLRRVIIGTLVVFVVVLVVMVQRGRRRRRVPAAQPPEPGPLEAKPKRVATLFVELIVIGFVALILAMIAVPNFLEAQTRSKVSRVKSDQRSLATAIESYFVDNNAYPARVETLWQGPVHYMSGGLFDPFASAASGGRGKGFSYVVGPDAIARAQRAGLLAPGPTAPPASFWLTYSLGPDGRDDGGEIVYDPTNGTVSRGDVIRTSQGAGQGWDSRYAGVAKVEQQAESAARERFHMVVPAPSGGPRAGVAGEAAKAKRVGELSNMPAPTPLPTPPGAQTLRMLGQRSASEPEIPGRPAAPPAAHALAGAGAAKPEEAPARGGRVWQEFDGGAVSAAAKPQRTAAPGAGAAGYGVGYGAGAPAQGPRQPAVGTIPEAIVNGSGTNLGLTADQNFFAYGNALNFGADQSASN